MAFDLKKTLEALLLSTAEPVALKDMLKVFSRYRERREQTEASGDGAEGSGEASGDGPPGGEARGESGAVAAREDAPDAGERAAGTGDDAPPALITKAMLREALEALQREAEAEDKAYRIVEGPNGFQLVTAPGFADYVRLLRGDPPPIKLSAAALETLAIAAYRQPVTRAEMEAIRGVSVDSSLNKLLELELVRSVGRADLPGRPIQYGTTDRFLELTGIRELEELPASDVLSDREIDAWMRRGEGAEGTVSDEDMGLPEEAGAEAVGAGEQAGPSSEERAAPSSAAGERGGDGAEAGTGREPDGAAEGEREAQEPEHG